MNPALEMMLVVALVTVIALTIKSRGGKGGGSPRRRGSAFGR